MDMQQEQRRTSANNVFGGGDADYYHPRGMKAAMGLWQIPGDDARRVEVVVVVVLCESSAC